MKVKIILALILLFIIACNKDFSPLIPTAPQQITIHGKVNTQLYPKPSDLFVSSLGKTSDINAQGEYQISVYKNRFHLLFLINKQDSTLRGITYLYIEPSTGRLQVQEFNDQSMSIAMLLMAPQIVNGVNPQNIPALISKIISAPHFPEFATFVQKNFILNASPESLSSSEFQELLQLTLQESGIMPDLSDVFSLLLPHFEAQCQLLDYFTLNYKNSQLLLENSGLRYVSVYRKDYYEDGSVSVVPVYTGTSAMRGMPIYALENIFGDWAKYPNIQIDNGFPPEGNVDHSEYWIQGPGFCKNQSLPTDIPNESAITWLLTIHYYLLKPILKVMLGNNLLKKDDRQSIEVLMNIYETDEVLRTNLENLQYKNSQELLSSLKEILIPLAQQYISKIGDEFILNQILGKIELFISTLNISNFLAFYLTANQVIRIQVDNPNKYVLYDNIMFRFNHNDCSGPAGWYEPDFLEIRSWEDVVKGIVDDWVLLKSVPWAKWTNSNYGDAFFRVTFYLEDTTGIQIKVISDDGSEIFINGHSLGWQANEGCHQEGCINMQGMGCGINTEVGPIPHASQYLIPGKNILAVHVSNGRANRIYFHFRIIKSYNS